MRVFLDFEASSLRPESYPIEVGWAGEDGSLESWLIRPAPGWDDWDPAAEAVHGLSREKLLAAGRPHEEVARRTLEALQDHEVYVSAPSWDGKWMSVLLRAAGLPRHALRLKDVEEAARAAVAEVLPGRSDDEIGLLAAVFLTAARKRFAETPPKHRALADAEDELAIWREVRRLAQAAVAGELGPAH